ncbi:MAG: acetyl/propionyl/methylcrotonyl-CoA carboxylase subunit alpha [Xanthomonadales bacterium]|nr:acetyl/propionyl/methylcrotonyl-CoA carboxylase subunit alpha [Xanthomonadales bacterium]ODU93610.1 MAG: 3-methylcrotonyl-CoA carboxylase [Rhodanobacter sp. SCN 66-43]OJY86706.1 MAG: 3-methylcrotonyl-CoA carboxylase [Xanthomonadales bacterium 66-474]
MFERVLIANRGEIACRVIRTCRRLGIHTIAVYSEADRDAQHVRLADEAWPIGGPRPDESYLRGDAIIEVAKRTGAQAIHPGYGFLSENTGFSRACKDAGIVFIGPDPESIEAMGSKAAAKNLMAKHKVPLVPGYSGDNQDSAFLAQQAHKIGYPLILKPSAGGGGKGMQIVRSDAEFPDALATAQRVAKASFGDASMLLERYIEHPRHIEFQVFGDRHGNVIHLDERECSAQRRYQKVLEETPSPFLDAARRAAMGAAAVAAAKAVNYVGAGTVEFIVGRHADGSPGDFHFMEMNTRLQVEHPVTEMTHGIDLVEWQLRVANGEPLPLAQEAVQSRGHAIEVRLYAEDPDHGFLPGSGKLARLQLPEASAHVRLDGGVVEGDAVTIFYDPMIAKLIVWDVDRPSALQRMREALAACEIVGPKSNVAFLERLVRHPAIVEGRIDTGYLDRHLDEFVAGETRPSPETVFAAVVASLQYDERHVVGDPADPHSPWNTADAWRIGHPGKRIVAFAVGDRRFEIEARGHAGGYLLQCGDAKTEITGARWDDRTLSARFDGEARRFDVRADASRVLLHDAAGFRWRLERVPAFAWEASGSAGGNQVAAPMPGRVVLVKARAGDKVEAGQELLVMEAMKMELSLKAPRAGVIESVSAAASDFVDADMVLVRFADP